MFDFYANGIPAESPVSRFSLGPPSLAQYCEENKESEIMEGEEKRVSMFYPPLPFIVHSKSFPPSLSDSTRVSECNSSDIQPLAHVHVLRVTVERSWTR